MPRLFVHRLSILLLASSWFASPSGGQTFDQAIPGYVARRWTITEGLPQNAISALLRTSDGYLWIGTANAGLVRFDGLTFRAFSVLDVPAFQSNRIRVLHEGAGGTLWIGTDSGLVRYRDGVFTAEQLGGDAVDNVVVDIKTDREGRLWVAAQGRVVRRDGDAWTVIPTGPDRTYQLVMSPDGTVWIATAAGVLEWRDEIVRSLTARDGLPDDVVFALHEDRRGRLWIGTRRGLAVLDPDSPRMVTEAAGAGTRPIHAIFEDSLGALWLGAPGRVIMRSVDGAFHEYRVGNLRDSDTGPSRRSSKIRCARSGLGRRMRTEASTASRERRSPRSVGRKGCRARTSGRSPKLPTVRCG